jgi:hypothetical protein
MKKIIYILIFFVFSGSISAQTEVQIKVKTVQGGKPPLRFYIADIKISNSQEKPCWVIFPGYAEDSLIKDGIFEADKQWKIEYLIGKGFTGKMKNGSSGKMAEVIFLGKYKESFHAFLVPGKSSLNIENYSIEADTDPDSIEVATAKALMVNDSIELEQFLPYRIISDKNLTVDLNKNSEWDNLSWDKETLSYRKDLPQNNVRFIHAREIKIFRKPFKK